MKHLILNKQCLSGQNIKLDLRMLMNVMVRLSCLCVALFHLSCEDFVEVDLPSSQLGSEAVFMDMASANAAMGNVFASIRDQGILCDLSYNMGLYSDELDLYGSGTTNAQSFYQNALVPSDLKIRTWWNYSYSQIYNANAILENINKSDQLSKEVIDRLTGEALFVRGLLHFYLSQLYGEIPYLATTDYNENAVVSKMSVNDIFTKTEEDLLQAISLLPRAYLSADRTRPNKAVAMAFLSRIYLYNQQWEKALEMSGLVLSQSDLYQWEEDLDRVFLKESYTTLLQWYPKFEGNNTPEGRVFIFDAPPPGNVALTNDLVESFDDNDLRLSHWIREISNSGESWYHPFKYKEKGSTQPVKEYSIVFRLAELYLIRSEASVQLGDYDQALDDLNKVRSRAGLDNITTTDPATLLQLILQERKHEFFAENGHRFFDLKRNNKLEEVLNELKSGWNSTDQLLPLPEKELVLNPNLEPQNPGY